MTQRLLTTILMLLMMALSRDGFPETYDAGGQGYRIPGYQKTLEWWTSWTTYAETVHRAIDNIHDQANRDGNGKAAATAFGNALNRLYPGSSYSTGSPEGLLRANQTTDIMFSTKDFNINRIIVRQGDIARTYTFRHPTTLGQNYAYQASDGRNSVSFLIYAGDYEPEYSFFNAATVADADMPATEKLKGQIKSSVATVPSDPLAPRTVNGYTAMMLNIVYLNAIGPKGTLTMAETADSFVTNSEFRGNVVTLLERMDPSYYNNMLWNRPKSMPQKYRNKDQGDPSAVQADPLQNIQPPVITRKFTPYSDSIPRLARGVIKVIFRLAIVALIVIVILTVRKVINAPPKEAHDKDEPPMQASTAPEKQAAPPANSQADVQPAPQKSMAPTMPATPKPPAPKKKVKKPIVKHLITTDPSEGGKIIPSGDLTYQDSSTPSFKIQPDPEYIVLDVQIDGTTVGPRTYYKFPPLKKQHTIRALFSPNPIMQRRKEQAYQEEQEEEGEDEEQ